MQSLLRAGKPVFNCHYVYGCAYEHKALPLVECVRWRKRRWAPIAKSKEFRPPPERKPKNPEEYEELKTRYAHYRTSMKAIRLYFQSERKRMEQQAVSEEVFAEKERKFQALLAINDKWNEDTKKIREERQAEEDIKTEDKTLARLIKYEERREHRRIRSEKLVEKEIELVKEFFDMDNLDVEIEKVLNRRVNYNFAIDLEGNRHLEQADGSTVLVPKQEVKSILQTFDMTPKEETKF